jgi:hypothetical protein
VIIKFTYVPKISGRMDFLPKNVRSIEKICLFKGYENKKLLIKRYYYSTDNYVNDSDLSFCTFNYMLLSFLRV